MNSRTARYSKLTSIEEIAAEKKALGKLISSHEKTIGDDWKNIRSAWRIVSKLRKGLGFVTNVLPVGLGVGSFLLKLFSKK